MGKNIGPQKQAFDKAAKADKWNKCFTLVGGFFSLSVILIDSFSCLSTTVLNIVLKYIAIALFIAIAISQIIYSCFKFDAETKRRDGLIDNAYGTKFASSASKNYYDTDRILLGPIKQLATIHENCLYTNRIAKSMRALSFIKSGAMLIILLIMLRFGQDSLFEILLQLFVSSLFVLESLDLFFLTQRTTQLEKAILTTWSTHMEDRKSNNFLAEVERHTLQYECTIIDANLILSNRIYKKKNECLKQEWDECIRRYHLESIR